MKNLVVERESPVESKNLSAKKRFFMRYAAFLLWKWTAII